MPLHCALDNNSKEVAKLLILKGALINAKDIIYQKLKYSFRLIKFKIEKGNKI